MKAENTIDNPKIQYLASFRRASDCFRHGGVRCYGSERGVSNQLRDELAKERVKTLERQQKARREAKALDKVRCTHKVDVQRF